LTGSADQSGRLVLKKRDDAKDLRRALKSVARSLNRRIRFPFRGEEGSLSLYLEGKRGRRTARRRHRLPPAPRRRSVGGGVKTSSFV
jgi:hypothetical protein